MHINGRAVYDVLYETDYKSKLRCCSIIQEFNQSIPLPKNELADIVPDAGISCRRITCKLLSPRRFVLKATLGTSLSAEGSSNIKAVAVTDSDDTFFAKKVIGFDGKKEIFREEFHFSEPVPLSQGERSIGDIVYGTVTLQPPQINLSPGQASVRTSANAHILYEDEENESQYIMSTKTVPVDITYSNPSIEDFKRLDISLSVTDTEITNELDQYGENRVLKISFTVMLTMRLCEPIAYTVASDMFSPGFEDTLVNASESFPRMHSSVDKSFTVETKLSPSEPLLTEIYSAAAKDYGSKTESVDGGINVSGVLFMTVLGNTGSGIYSFDYSVPYEQFLSLKLPEGDYTVVTDVVPFDVLPTLHSDGSISARVICGAKIYVYEQYTESFISEVSAHREKKDDSSGYPVIFCFPSRSDSRWSIAKQYYVNPESLSVSNPGVFGENGEILQRGKPILIKK